MARRSWFIAVALSLIAIAVSVVTFVVMNSNTATPSPSSTSTSPSASTPSATTAPKALAGTLGAWRDIELSTPDTLGLATQAKHLDVVALTGFQIADADTVTHMASAPHQLRAIKTASPTAVTLITIKDDEIDQAVMKRILLGSQQDRLVKTIQNVLAANPSADGISLDLEFSLPDAMASQAKAAQLRAGLTRFVTQLAESLHRSHKLLTVAVPVKMDDSFNADWTKPYLFDLKRLGSAADRLDMMTYDEHWSTSDPGAIATMTLVKSTMDYASTQVPASKLAVGVAAYGYDWTVDASGHTVLSDGQVQPAASLTVTSALEQAETYGAEIATAKNGEQSYSYTAKGQHHRVWLSGVGALRSHVAWAKAHGYSAMIWRVGDQDPSGTASLTTLVS